jgi:CubicO group peptidase (beta-lactamase class C family)
MQLVESGKVNLDDKINKHLEWFRSAKDKDVQNITIRHFLNHTSGLIRDGIDSNYWQLDRSFPDKEELIAFVKDSHLQILKTNENFKYSNFGYSYLGMIIEKISGVSYSEYVDTNIIKKIGLNDTYPELSDVSLPKLAKGHTPILFNSKRTTVDHVNTNGMSSATGFSSTGLDLCKYFIAHCQGDNRLLSDASKREMQHGYWSSEDINENYGLGFAEYRHGKNTYYGHGGGFPGFITNSRFDPQQKLIVVVLTNAWDGPAGLIAKKIVNIINYFQFNEGKTKNAQKFEGRFFAPWDMMDIVNVNGKLISSGPRYWGDFEGENSEELEYKNQNTLKLEKKNSYNSPGEEIIYEYDTSGKIKFIINAGTKMLFEEDYLKKLKVKYES